MVDLETALKLTDVTSDDEIVYLRKSDATPAHRSDEILSLAELKKKYNLKATMVTNIRPYFICGDYEGFLFTVKEADNYK